MRTLDLRNSAALLPTTTTFLTSIPDNYSALQWQNNLTYDCWGSAPRPPVGLRPKQRWGIRPQTPPERGLGRSPSGCGVWGRGPQLHSCGEAAGDWGGAPAGVGGGAPSFILEAKPPGSGGGAPSFILAAKPPGSGDGAPSFVVAAKPPPGSVGGAPRNIVG